MPKEVAVLVNALPIVDRGDLDGEDRMLVPGVHVLYIEESLAPELKADAALDVFHSCVPVSVLDDFSFTVLDGETGEVLVPSGERQDYELADAGEYGYLQSDEPLQLGQADSCVQAERQR